MGRHTGHRRARQSRSNHRARICRDGLHRCDRICCRSHAHRQSRAAPSLPQPPEPEPQHAMRQARNQSSLAAGVAAATGRFSQRASELRTASPDATQQRSIAGPPDWRLSRERAARRHGGQELPRRRWWHVGSTGDGAVEKGGGKAGDGARGDGALWRRCGSVQRADRHDEGCAALVS